MPAPKKEHPKIKSTLHLRNKHRERYDFKLLIDACPELGAFVKPNAYNDLSIDFFDPQAVKALNKALLKQYYDITNWDIPDNYLCPPIPGRADYIHHIADLLGKSNNGKKPTGNKIKVLDIGVGANCVYPLIGNREYGWTFVGSDIDPVAIKSANKIIESNPHLKGQVELRLQKNPKNIFKGIIQADEKFDLTICNPPFHSSQKEAQSGSLRKISNLKHKKASKASLNFGGQSNELWCEGGEKYFIENMILESKMFSDSCSWFSTLVAKSASLDGIYYAFKKTEAVQVETIPMGQGNKISRIVAWTFFKK